MPRRPRVTLPGVPLHIIQRGNNREACFYADDDYRSYLHWLKQYATECRCAIHAYVLMTNHVHLLLTSQTATGTSELMKHLGQRYVQYVNRTYGRSGTLWEGRFRSCLTQEESYLLGCYRYIELNPVRANMVTHPAEYAWSSYAANAQGSPTAIITPHPRYNDLGIDPSARQASYRALFRDQLDPQLVNEIRAATNGNYALGSPAFESQVARALARRVSRGKPGRPRKCPDVSTQDLFGA